LSPAEEARLEPAESGLVPVTDGWFVLNVRDAAWLSNEAFGRRAVFEGSGPALRGRPDLPAHRFDQIGINLAFVIFDSQVPPSGAAAVYVSAIAEELSGEELESGIEVFSRKSVSDGLPEYSREDVQQPAKLRLYRAVATEHFALGAGNQRMPVDPS
jgi:hypothetical protein